ncbi:MocR-like pyridoxine biosynthesis transcription factor PdxR [Agromyces marinus]|uniref:MocR-like pyridoxine biosynthesis transcription factor PdxR n=1 Tax=Agromyces marinus TaxID=1389020 RepID=UPI001F208F08|nr:PLP-dependent aminotransferase family protein [Agromyces marinus]UIP57245.1 HTH-type transcriptional regulatory protein GabR [Agromyces marinus]
MDGPLLAIDRHDRRPIGVQIVEGLRHGILDGRLRSGDPVPSTRGLASELGVSRSTVTAAYDQLAGEGYLELRQGAAPRVAQRLAHAQSPVTTVVAGPRAPQPAASVVTGARLLDLRPGLPSTARIDERAWRAAWRRAAATPVPGDIPAGFGAPRLRAELADHLRHARGLACEPDDVVVTAGTSDAVALVASALQIMTDAAPRVAVEHPGYPSARRILERRGTTAAVPVDEDGIDLGALRGIRPPPHAVMVTPSHQYPLGGRLPVASRLALLDWAEHVDALVLEDDYDSEFRHVGPPLPALASLDRSGRAILIGSLSKVLTPSLRLGYLVLPPNPRLREAIAAVRDDETTPVPGIAQEAVAELLASGALRRHIAAVRRDYAHRRRLVQAALGGIRHAPLSGLDGGLHAVIRLTSERAATAVVERLAGEGIAVASLADYAAVGGDGPHGIVFGYGSPTDSQLAGALPRLRAAVEAAA